MDGALHEANLARRLSFDAAALLQISSDQFAELKKLGAARIAARVCAYLAAGSYVKEPSRDAVLDLVRFAIGCGLESELQIAQTAIFFVTERRHPSSADRRTLGDTRRSWPARYFEATGLRLPEEA